MIESTFSVQTLTFVPPSKSPTEPSANYVGRSNFTLPRSKLREGIAFDRFITVISNPHTRVD